jgi:RND family efflux transporter MFP subunit
MTPLTLWRRWPRLFRRSLPALALTLAAACHSSPPASTERTGHDAVSGQRLTVRDTVIPNQLAVSGHAAPFRQAVLGTRLMGSVTQVLVREGQGVGAGQLLARIDSRDLSAQGSQARAGLAEAEAVYRDAEVQATRFRALYADSAAPKAQLDAAETGLLRATAAVANARAAAAGIEAVASYAEVRAPFAGTITRRSVDPGALVAPGTPMLTIEDGSQLRLEVAVAPTEARGVKRGDRLEARVEDVAVPAVIEGVVPAGDGALYTINALVDNSRGLLLSGGTATLLLPGPVRSGVLIPVAALVREGELTGVQVWPAEGGSELRWVRTGWTDGSRIEVLAGLRAGEVIGIPGTGDERP